MIEHRGRKSGQLFRTVVEVAGRSERTGEWYVVSGFGLKADWYRNIRAGQLEAIWLGARRTSASARFVEPGEAGSVMEKYEEAHPRAARALMRVLGVGHDGTSRGRAQMMTQMPMVAFKPSG